MIIIKRSNVNKISLHISTFGMRLSNIVKIAVFTELVHKKLPEKLEVKGIINNIANKQSFSLRIVKISKFDKKTEEYVYIKKLVYPNDRITTDFMLCLSNDESEVIDSPLLGILKIKATSCPSIGNVIIKAKLKFKLELVEKLLQKASIKGFNLLFLLE